MRDLKLRDTSRSLAACLACEEDSSFLDLLCEDGFLTAEELAEEDGTPVSTWKLIRRAIGRGFLTVDRDASCLDALVVKKLDTLRVWTDLVDESVHLRAPPRHACA